MTFQTQIRGMLRFVEDVETKTDKLTAKGALVHSLYDKDLDTYVEMPGTQIIATNNGTALADQLYELEGQMVLVSGFFVPDCSADKYTTRQVKGKTYTKAPYKALRVQAIVPAPADVETTTAAEVPDAELLPELSDANTVREIKLALKAAQVEFNSSATKPELLALANEARSKQAIPF